MSAPPPAEGWQVRLVRPRLGWLSAANGPAEVGELLCETMLARENVLEDAQYNKTVPNQFVVELAPEVYARHYAPLRPVIEQQWRERLLNHLATANSRQGRREYRFAGQVGVETRPSADLEPTQLRILSRWQSEGPAEPATLTPALLPACLELLSNGRPLPAGRQPTKGRQPLAAQSWRLHAGLVTLGRDPTCDVFLDLPRVQALKLVSSQHAYLQCSPGVYRLFDGSPGGLASVNGTFVNGQPVPPGGRLLQEGDVVILAAVRPQAPRLDTPGVVGLRFRAQCA